MLRSRRWPALVLLAVASGTGCTSLREIPRVEYTARVPERPVRVVTRTGLVYDLDMASVQSDTLVGYHRRDVESRIDEYDVLRLPMEEVATISARRIDWYRTALVGGLSLGAVVAAGMARHGSGSTGETPTPCGYKDCPE